MMYVSLLKKHLANNKALVFFRHSKKRIELIESFFTVFKTPFKFRNNSYTIP